MTHSRFVTSKAGFLRDSGKLLWSTIVEKVFGFPVVPLSKQPATQHTSTFFLAVRHERRPRTELPSVFEKVEVFFAVVDAHISV